MKKPTYKQLEAEIVALKEAEDERRKEDKFWNALRDSMITPLTPEDIFKMAETEEKMPLEIAKKWASRL